MKKGELLKNVKDFEAKGDGTTDDTIFIQNAISLEGIGDSVSGGAAYDYGFGSVLKYIGTTAKPIIKLSIGIAIISIIYRIIRYKSVGVEDYSLDETFLIMIKFVFYSLLAGYIYIVLKKMNYPKIDVLTYMTFLLACFEATHNFMLSIGCWIAGMLRLVFRMDKRI